MYSYLTNTRSFHFPYPESLRLAEHWIKELDMEQASEHNPWRRHTTDITPNLWQDKKQQIDEEIFKFQAIWDLTMLQWRGNPTLQNWRVVFNSDSHTYWPSTSICVVVTNYHNNPTSFSVRQNSILKVMKGIGISYCDCSLIYFIWATILYNEFKHNILALVGKAKKQSKLHNAPTTVERPNPCHRQK